MDGLAREVLARLPLAEAVLRVWRWMAEERYLQEVFDRYGGRSYERVISFPSLVQLIADALVQHGGSGRQSFERAREQGELDASIQAAYGKLRRLPVELSMGFLAECTQRLAALYPACSILAGPRSLRRFEIVIVDGKAVKRLSKRLKALRGIFGGMVGGRALVAMSLRNGLALTMQAHPDGDCNEVRFVPELLEQTRERISGSRLWVCDRAFCGMELLSHFSADEDHFLVRYSKRAGFWPDSDRPSRRGRDPSGRRYVERWGWLGRAKHPHRRYVRQIWLDRAEEEPVVLLTDLLDPERYPADDLLALYLSRWGIERMFQEVTEVFQLQRLIGSTPEASLFQLAFCLVLYNVIQLIRAYVATAQRRRPETLSTEKLFVDVQRELIAWSVLVSATVTLAYLKRPASPDQVRKSLSKLLAPVWTKRWIKSPPQPGRRDPARLRGSNARHLSAYRILQVDRQHQKTRRRKSK